MDESVYLQKIDPERNMRRFYRTELRPTLFGEISVCRQWGRIGAPGQAMIETFPDEASAVMSMARLVAAKRRKGYRPL